MTDLSKPTTLSAMPVAFEGRMLAAAIDRPNLRLDCTGTRKSKDKAPVNNATELGVKPALDFTEGDLVLFAYNRSKEDQLQCVVERNDGGWIWLNPDQAERSLETSIRVCAVSGRCRMGGRIVRTRILDFGQAPLAEMLGYPVLVAEYDGSDEQALFDFSERDVILVRSAALQGLEDQFRFGVFAPANQDPVGNAA